jgi:hypothetical protein
MVARKEVHQGRMDVAPRCPTCKAILDGFTAVGHNHDPDPGSVTVCSYCEEVLQFEEDLSLKLASQEVKEQLASDSNFKSALKAIRRNKNG